MNDNMPASVVAIDGPAASGKSVVGAAVAAALGYRFLDTGAMYRGLTWYLLRNGIDVRDAAAAGDEACRTRVEVRSKGDDAEPMAVFVDGLDATPHLRDDDVERAVSLVSRVPAVRDLLVRIQREIAAGGAVVMAGRDIGSVVLPGAQLKVYLDASPRVRAERRARQLQQLGGKADVDAITQELERRDRIDSTREASPLTAAADAVIIHTDGLALDEVVTRVVELASA